MKKITQKKGQMSIGEAPMIVMLVGLTFLVMATIALIGEKYGNSLDTDDVAGTVLLETLDSNITQVVQTVDKATLENFASFTVTALNITNHSGTTKIVPASNYTVGSAGTIFLKATANAEYNNTVARVSYTYTYTMETSASNVTTDMNTEIANNTSIAGIVLTISLVGIVLSILIGVFLGIRGRTRI